MNPDEARDRGLIPEAPATYTLGVDPGIGESQGVIVGPVDGSATPLPVDEKLAAVLDDVSRDVTPDDESARAPVSPWEYDGFIIPVGPSAPSAWQGSGGIAVRWVPYSRTYKGRLHSPSVHAEIDPVAGTYTISTATLTVSGKVQFDGEGLVFEGPAGYFLNP